MDQVDYGCLGLIHTKFQLSMWPESYYHNIKLCHGMVGHRWLLGPKEVLFGIRGLILNI